MDSAARDGRRGVKKSRRGLPFPARSEPARASGETEERFRFIYENNPTMYFIVDEAGTIQSVNRYGAEYLGYTVQELVGRPVLAVVHQDDHDKVRKHLAECVRTPGRVCRWEFRKVRKDGSILWVQELARAVRKDDSGALDVLIVCEDVSAAKRAAASQHFLTEASNVLASSLDYERTLRSVGRLAVPTVADYCVVHMVDDAGHVDRIVVAHRDPEKEAVAQGYVGRLNLVADVVRDVLATGKPVLVRNISNDDLTRLVGHEELIPLIRSLGTRSLIVTAMQARGRVLGSITLVASDRDYDENDRTLADNLASRAALAVDNARLYREAERRARIEQSLREAVAALHAAGTTKEVIQQIAVTAAQATDSDSSFVTRLRAGREPLEIIGQREPLPPSSLVPSSDALYTRQILEQKKSLLIPRLGDLRGALGASPLVHRWPDGVGLGVPLISGDQRIGVLFLVRAPGKAVFSQEEVERAGTLGQLASAAFRNRHLLEESEQRRQELERVTESRARLMRGFSHNVKNPLGSADGYAQLLEDGISGELGERQLDAVKRIRRSIQSSLAVIQDLLDVAQAEAGQIRLDRVRTDISAVIREAAEDFRPQASEAGFALEVSSPDELFVETDVRRVRQVLDNLISNALKYGGDTMVTLTVETKSDGPTGRPGEWVALSVSDKGPGIPVENQEEAFREFTRLERAGPWSSGLGLSISRSLARLLGGDLTVESTPGRGSTFTLWLPLHHQAA